MNIMTQPKTSTRSGSNKIILGVILLASLFSGSTFAAQLTEASVIIRPPHVVIAPFGPRVIVGPRFGHRGYGRRGYGHRGYGHRGYGHRGYGHRGYGHRGYGHRGRY